MEFWSQLVQLSSAIREFVVPSYRPELHYMRGPGPAYRRRVAMLEGRRQGPRFGGDATLAG
jgi:hypothetical protein